ncbi:hypothetical protein DFS34DRAFT_574137 [Phlyctochytrium arcticum]|nr:hypothetical protein DFS34DRAFT_574137 [Phlyctochytrium arcticum]
MQEREFQNMFIFSAGFEAATLKIPSMTDSDDGVSANNNNNNSARKQIIGFAKFRTRLDALEARDVLSGRKVDAERGCVLKAEMAKKNLHTKRATAVTTTRARPTVVPPTATRPLALLNNTHLTQNLNNTQSLPQPTPQDQNPPCNTLYVGNLPPDTSETELRHLFSLCPGYKRLCFRPRPAGPMCFVEFENVACATRALVQLYGNPLSNSTKGGIRLSYSKNPLGVRPAAAVSMASPSNNPMAPTPPPPFLLMKDEGRLIHGH